MSLILGLIIIREMLSARKIFFCSGSVTMFSLSVFELSLEYLTNIIHDNVDQLYRVWHPFLGYIGLDLYSTLLKRTAVHLNNICTPRMIKQILHYAISLM